jgi:hypothetical protein
MRRLRDDDIARLREVVVAARGPEPEPENWLDRATHRRIIVHLIGDHSITGTLVLNASDGLLLWAAQLLLHPTPETLGGEVFIPLEQVLFVQTDRT